MSDRVPGVAVERFRLGGELQQGGDALRRDLGRRLRAADDLLCARFDGAWGVREGRAVAAGSGAAAGRAVGAEIDGSGGATGGVGREEEEEEETAGVDGAGEADPP